MFFGRSRAVPACLGDDLRCKQRKKKRALRAPLPWGEAVEKATGKGELGDENIPRASLSFTLSRGLVLC